MFRKKQNRQQPARARQPAYRQLRTSNFNYFSPSTDNLEQLNRARQEEQRRASAAKRPVYAALAAIVLLAAIIYGTFLGDTPKVEIQKSSGPVGSLQNDSTYASYAKKLIDKNFSNRNKITINTTAIALGLKKQFPEISNVSVTVPIFGSRPVITIEPSNIALILQEAGGQFYSINEAGLTAALVTSPQSDKLPIITDESGLNVSVGTQELPQSYVVFVEALDYQLQAKHISIKSQKLTADGELDVYPAGVNYYVKFNLNDQTGAQQQIGDFLAVRQYLAEKGITPTQYIDARVPGRAYYN